jgi:mRNA interferase YafQ
MLEIYRKKSFKKDIKRVIKYINENIKNEINLIITTLIEEKSLNKKYCNHLLKGNWKYCYDCHILPDLVLIYQIDKINNRLILVRIGSHSELFK